MTALKNEENHELRVAVLSGAIEPAKLVVLSQTQLATRKMQELQEQQKQKFFKEQVIINEPVPLISKSKKGEEVLLIRPNDLQLIQDDQVHWQPSVTEAPGVSTKE